jgi:hypothetical protein
MLAQSAGVAALLVVMAVVSLMAETVYLAPYKRLLFVDYGAAISTFLFVLWANVTWVLYSVRRLVGLKHTGRKLHHLDRQLGTPDSVLTDLTARLEEDDR